MDIIGIDVAKATFDLALPLAQGKYRTQAQLANDPAGRAQLLAWRGKHALGAAVGMEATGIHHEAPASALVQAGVAVYVVNPAQIEAYGASELLRTKTDRTDAKLIARFFQARLPQGLPAYVPPTPSQARLRALVGRLEDLKQMRQMEGQPAGDGRPGHRRGHPTPPVLSSAPIWSPIPNETEIGREETLFRRTDHRVPA